MSTNQGTSSLNTNSMSVIVGITLFVLLSGLFFLIPVQYIECLLETEWNSSLTHFGKWPATATNTIYRDLSIDDFSNELLAVQPGNTPSNKLEADINDYASERALAIRLTIALILLRSCNLLFWIGIFLPVAFLSFWSGLSERESLKNTFFFTSPFKMKTYLTTFRLQLGTTVLLILAPITINPWAFPLVTGILALSCGKFIKYLQKEI